MEVLAGARDERHPNDLRRLLARGTFLATEPTRYEVAALYRVCRRSGASVPTMIDCLIASVALRSGTPVLHADAGVDVVAMHTSLAIDQVRSRPCRRRGWCPACGDGEHPGHEVMSRSSPADPSQLLAGNRRLVLGLLDPDAREIRKQSAQVRGVGAENDAGACVGGVGGDDGINAARDAASTGMLHAEPQVTRTTSRGLRGVDGAEPMDDLVGRRVLPTPSDHLRENHRGDDGVPSGLDEIAQHPAKLWVGDRLVDHSRVKNGDGVAHRSMEARSLSALRAARRLVGSGVGSAASSSSRYSRNARRRSSRSSLSSRAASR